MSIVDFITHPVFSDLPPLSVFRSRCLSPFYHSLLKIARQTKTRNIVPCSPFVRFFFNFLLTHIINFLRLLLCRKFFHQRHCHLHHPGQYHHKDWVLFAFLQQNEADDKDHDKTPVRLRQPDHGISFTAPKRRDQN